LLEFNVFTIVVVDILFFLYWESKFGRCQNWAWVLR